MPRARAKVTVVAAELKPASFPSLPWSSAMGWMGCFDCIPDSHGEVPVHVLFQKYKGTA